MTSLFHPISLTAVAAVVLGMSTTAFAQPRVDAKGFAVQQYWMNSDHGGFRPRGYGGTYPTPYAPATAISPAVTSSSVVSGPGTIAVRGPDGVLRNYPVVGGDVAQRVIVNGQIMTATRGSDGVIRYTPSR